MEQDPVFRALEGPGAWAPRGAEILVFQVLTLRGGVKTSLGAASFEGVPRGQPQSGKALLRNAEVS